MLWCWCEITHLRPEWQTVWHGSNVPANPLLPSVITTPIPSRRQLLILKRNSITLRFSHLWQETLMCLRNAVWGSIRRPVLKEQGPCILWDPEESSLCPLSIGLVFPKEPLKPTVSSLTNTTEDLEHRSKDKLMAGVTHHSVTVLCRDRPGLLKTELGLLHKGW